MAAGYSLLDLGPSGAGKSTLLASALRAEGSGIIALAPGDDERASFSEFVDRDGFAMQGFDDADFAPSLDEWQADGHVTALKWLRERSAELRDDMREGRPPRYRVLVTDTLTAFLQLGVNKALANAEMLTPPKAMSADGASFFTAIQAYYEEFVRTCRAIKGLGPHWLASGHVSEKEAPAAASVSGTATAGKYFAPLVLGSFREKMPGFFDLVVYAGVKRDGDARRHYVLWKPDPRRPTKSRFGDLADASAFPNDWRRLRELIERCEAAKTLAAQEKRQ